MDQIKKALDELTERQRGVFVLRHFQNLRLREVAEVMAVPIGTVKATLHQTLNKLRGLLSKDKQNAFDEDTDSDDSATCRKTESI